MPVRGPNDEIHVEIGIFYNLASRGFVCPDGIKIEIVLDSWITDYEQGLAKEIIRGRITDDAPLRHPCGDEEQICVTSVEAVDDHVRAVEKDLY